MLSALITISRHDILVTLRQAFSWLTPLLFFVIIVSLFPLALGPDEASLHKIAPSIIWVAVLLAILLSMGNLFRSDCEEGHLDLLLLSPYPLTLLVLCKIISHWISYCLPLILVSPLLGALFHLTLREEWVLIISLLLGTPALCLIGAIGAALTVGIRTPGLLLPILIMPLYVPILIFGTSAMVAASQHLPVNAYFAILGAFILLSMSFAPWLTASALRLGVYQ